MDSENIVRFGVDPDITFIGVGSQCQVQIFIVNAAHVHLTCWQIVFGVNGETVIVHVNIRYARVTIHELENTKVQLVSNLIRYDCLPIEIKTESVKLVQVGACILEVVVVIILEDQVILNHKEHLLDGIDKLETHGP